MRFRSLSREARYLAVEIPERVQFKPDNGTVLPDTLIFMFSFWTKAAGCILTRLGFRYSSLSLKAEEQQNFCTSEMCASPSMVSVRTDRRVS